MRIGIDCRKIYDVNKNSGAGVERYTYHFVKNLLKKDQDNDYVLFFYSDISPETIHKLKGNNPRVRIVKFIRSESRVPFFDTHLKIVRLLNKHKFDYTIFPSGSIPIFYRGSSVLVVHDLAIYLHPEWFPDKQWFSTKVVVPRSIRKAKKIVAVSENTKKDIIKIFKTREDKITTIYPGIVVKDDYLDSEIEQVKKKYDIKNDYVLFIGTIEPRKNVTNLIKAFSNYIFETDSKLNLVLAGVKGWKFQKIFEKVNDMNNRLSGSQIKYIGQVSNRERNILLKNCEVFVFPSQYEGFGFPVLEAMALHAPVITGNNSSLAEISGEGANLIDTSDIKEIKNAINDVVNNVHVRQALKRKGYEQSVLFTWERMVEQFIELLNRAKQG